MAVSVAGGADVPCGIAHRGCFDLSGAVLTLVGPVAVLMPSYIPFAWPQSAASWILAQRICQYSLAQRRAVYWALLLAARRASHVLGEGFCL